MTYVSNVSVSRPLPTGFKPDADMNGFSWSNKIGMFFHVSDVVISPIKLPSMNDGDT